MPSPFPGMDPYLEAPDIWPDVHNTLAGVIRVLVNAQLPPPYYARLEMRQEVGIVDAPRPVRQTLSDVAVARGRQEPGPALKTRGAVSMAVSRPLSLTVECPPFRHLFIEIR